MLLILGTFRIDPDRLDYGYAEDVLDRGLIHVRELWQDDAAFARHVAAPHLVAWRATWPDLGIGNRDLRRYTVGPSEPA